MEFEKIKKILEQYHFFGHTVKRDGYNMRYTFWSVPYFAITATVEVIKIDPKEPKSPKIVKKIYLNNTEIDDIGALISNLKNIYKTHKEALYGKARFNKSGR